jgi:hypothetical protein
MWPRTVEAPMIRKSFMHLLAGWPPAGAAAGGIRHRIKQIGRTGRWHAGTGIVASQVNFWGMDRASLSG